MRTPDMTFASGRKSVREQHARSAFGVVQVPMGLAWRSLWLPRWHHSPGLPSAAADCTILQPRPAGQGSVLRAGRNSPPAVIAGNCINPRAPGVGLGQHRGQQIR